MKTFAASSFLQSLPPRVEGCCMCCRSYVCFCVDAASDRATYLRGAGDDQVSSGLCCLRRAVQRLSAGSTMVVVKSFVSSRDLRMLIDELTCLLGRHLGDLSLSQCNCPSLCKCKCDCCVYISKMDYANHRKMNFEDKLSPKIKQRISV